MNTYYHPPPTHTDGSSEIRSQEAASYRQGLGNYPALGGIIMSYST